MHVAPLIIVAFSLTLTLMLSHILLAQQHYELYASTLNTITNLHKSLVGGSCPISEDLRDCGLTCQENDSFKSYAETERKKIFRCS
uniref:Secreted protein n=1 Tax=Glossina palpalis gambiensis TaxID=67801 RepID=A0A1B0BI09_9MUSC